MVATGHPSSLRRRRPRHVSGPTANQAAAVPPDHRFPVRALPTLLRLGEPPSPVPEPLAELLFCWIDSRGNMNTATTPLPVAVPLSPSRQPLHPDVLPALLNDLGIPTTAGQADV